LGEIAIVIMALKVIDFCFDNHEAILFSSIVHYGRFLV